MPTPNNFFSSFLEFVRRQHPWAVEAFAHTSFTENFVSSAIVSISHSNHTTIVTAVAALAKLRQRLHYQQYWESHYPTHAISNPNFESGFMGYDFYITSEGPKLIEINTNAAAQLVLAFLNEYHGQAATVTKTDASIRNMIAEQSAQFGKFQEPSYSVIVDHDVHTQKTYFDMALHAAMMKRWGWEVRVADVTDLKFDTATNRLVDAVTGKAIDYVYNRFCDFWLETPDAEALRQAWASQAVLVSPNPYDYALLAQKSNLTQLSQPEFLAQMGVSEVDRAAILAVLPPVQLAQDIPVDELWANRRKLFFKPQAGFGSRGCYRGDGISKKAFDTVVHENYVVQPFFTPDVISVPGIPEPMKYDLRVFAYSGHIQGWAARVFSGQVTNFRTIGGGFATVNDSGIRQ